jgi:hypothetical protein
MPADETGEHRLVGVRFLHLLAPVAERDDEGGGDEHAVQNEQDAAERAVHRADDQPGDPECLAEHEEEDRERIRRAKDSHLEACSRRLHI